HCRAIAKGFPVETVLGVQHHFERIGPPALTLARAIKDIDVFGSRTQIRMGDQDNRVKPSVREIELPDAELGLHSGPWTQPDNKEASRSSRSRPSAPVKYLSRLPGGNISPSGCSPSFTGTRTMLPSGLSCRENT